MPYEPCSKLIEQGKSDLFIPSEEDGYIHEMTKNYGLCVDTNVEEAFVKGRISDEIFDYTQLEFFPCSLASGCASVEELKAVYFIYSTGAPNLNLESLKDPVTWVVNADDYFYIDPTSS